MSLFDSPIEGGNEYVKINQLVAHLAIYYPIGYIENIPTRFSQPGKPSDAVACDVVDLDMLEDNGQVGKIYRGCRFMQGQVIGNLRPRIGSRVLGRVAQGVSKGGGMNAPWVIVDASMDPEAVARATAWVEAHPDFKPSEFVPYVPRTQAPPQQQSYGPPPGYGQYNGGGYAPANQPPPLPVVPQPAPPQFVQPTYPQQPVYPPQQPQYAPQPQYAQPQQPAYGPGPSPQGPPPDWAVAPMQQAQAPVQQGPIAIPVQGSPTLGQEELSVLQRMRAQRDQAQVPYDPAAERAQFGF